MTEEHASSEKKAKKYNFASRTANGKAGDEAGYY
jgi:hypothetical protein